MIDDQWEGTDLYQRIAEEIRKKIVDGNHWLGDRLPPIRKLKQQWNCTQGTIQHTYRELAQQGLVISQAGKGTHLINQWDYGKVNSSSPWRKAKLVHRAESFLLESLITAYSFEEIEESLDLARRRRQSL